MLLPIRIEIQQCRVIIRLALYAHTGHISDSFFSLARCYFISLLFLPCYQLELESHGYTENKYEHVVGNSSECIQQNKMVEWSVWQKYSNDISRQTFFGKNMRFERCHWLKLDSIFGSIISHTKEQHVSHSNSCRFY